MHLPGSGTLDANERASANEQTKGRCTHTLHDIEHVADVEPCHGSNSCGHTAANQDQNRVQTDACLPRWENKPSMLKSVGLAVLGFLQDGTCATSIFALDQPGTPGMKNSNGMHLPGSGTLDVIFFTKSNAVKKMPNWRWRQRPRSGSIQACSFRADFRPLLHTNHTRNPVPR